MNLCEATQNELCLLLEPEIPATDLRDHLEKCQTCRAFAAKIRQQEQQLNNLAYPDSPNWASTVLGKTAVRPAASSNLARKERTLGKIAVAFALAASLLISVVGLLTQFQKNGPEAQISKNEGPAFDSVASSASFGGPNVGGRAANLPIPESKSLTGQMATPEIAGSFDPQPRLADGQPGRMLKREEKAPGNAKDTKGSENRGVPGMGLPRTFADDPKAPMGPNPAVAKIGPDTKTGNSASAPSPKMLTMAGGKPGATPRILVPERVKTLRNLLDQQRTLAVSLAKGDRGLPKAPSGMGGGAKPDSIASRPKPEAIITEYERLVGSNLPNLLGSLANLPPDQLSMELKPLLEHLQSSESEYSRLATQYPTDREWLRQIALLARIGILQIRTAQKEI